MLGQRLTFLFSLVIYWLFSLVKLISAAGQTYFGMKQAGDYLFTNLPTDVATKMTTALTMEACAFKTGANLLTDVPALYTQFVPEAKKATDKHATDKKIVFKHWRGSITNVALQGSAIASALTGPAIGTYFGTVVMLKLLTSLLRPNEELTTSEEILIQASSAVTGLMMLAPFYAFPFKKFIRPGCRSFAEQIDNLSGSCNVNTLKTIAVMAPSMISGPINAFYWAEPMLAQLPPPIFAFLGNSGVTAFAVFSAANGFISSLPMLTMMYDYFADDTPSDLPNTRLAKIASSSYYTTAIPDNLNASLLGYLGTARTIQAVFKINSTHPGTIIGGCLVGASTAVLGLTFGLKLGRDNLITTICPATPNARATPEERVRLLDDDTEQTSIAAANPDNTLTSSQQTEIYVAKHPNALFFNGATSSNMIIESGVVPDENQKNTNSC